MDATPPDSNPTDLSPTEAQRFARLIEPVRLGPNPSATDGEPSPEANTSLPASPEDSPPRPRDELRHGQPFMARAVFDFGRREEPEPRPLEVVERAPCPLCGEPNRLRHAYCKRCGFRLPWASELEGLPELEPRRNRLDQAVERAIADTSGARCRFCGSSIAPYDRRCQKCRRWLSSNWNRSALDSWQPDFDAWNFSQVRGFKSGCLSPIVLVVALVLWRVLA